MRKRRPSLLAELDSQSIDDWLSSLDRKPRHTSLEEVLDPGIATVSRFTDDELAEAIARGPNSKLGLIAASVLRSRESWRTPAKWAFVISCLSFGHAVWAFVRTL